MTTIKLPTRQELIDLMLIGTTMWWEWVDDGWVQYFSDCKDVYDHVYTLDLNEKRALQRQYDRVLSFEEKQAVFQAEAKWFTPQENGRIVVLKEYEVA